MVDVDDDDQVSFKNDTSDGGDGKSEFQCIQLRFQSVLPWTENNFSVTIRIQLPNYKNDQKCKTKCVIFQFSIFQPQFRV